LRGCLAEPLTPRFRLDKSEMSIDFSGIMSLGGAGGAGGAGGGKSSEGGGGGGGKSSEGGGGGGASDIFSGVFLCMVIF